MASRVLFVARTKLIFFCPLCAVCNSLTMDPLEKALRSYIVSGLEVVFVICISDSLSRSVQPFQLVRISNIHCASLIIYYFQVR